MGSFDKEVKTWHWDPFKVKHELCVTNATAWRVWHSTGQPSLAPTTTANWRCHGWWHQQIHPSTHPAPTIPCPRAPERDLLMHNHHLVLLPSLFLFLWNQISMVHFGNGFLGLTLLWINRYTSDLAFNILKSWGTAQRAALCPTWALCNLQVAACSARKASGSVFLSCPWKLFVDALLALAALSRRQEGAAAAGNVSSWCKQALKLFPSYLRGSEIQHPFIPIWFGHQEAWKIIT